MSFKKLFLISDEEDKKETTVTPVQGVPVVFPNFTNNSVITHSPPTSPTSHLTNSVSKDVFNNTLEIYEKGFDSLNQPGFDFYEYYKTVKAGGANNPSVYKMAFDMGKAIEPSISKNSLLSQTDFYISELNKVYVGFNEKGREKKEKLLLDKKSENEHLQRELDLLKVQLEQIQHKISEAQINLSSIDNKYNPLLNEIEEKLISNEQVKNIMISSIEEVKNGITNNLI